MTTSAATIISGAIRSRLAARAQERKAREKAEARRRAEAEAEARTKRTDPARAARWAEVIALASTNPLESFRAFCEEFIKIPTKEGGPRVPFRWNAIQRKFCEARTGRDIALKARQVGFTTLEEARDIWFAATRPGVNVVLVTIPDAKHLYTRKACADLEGMVDHLGVDVGARWSGTQVGFANGSTITVYDAGGSEKAASKTARSSTVHRVHLTEAAFYPYAQLTTTALLRALPSAEQGGELTEESTPNGAGGVFYEHWQSATGGGSSIAAHFFPWFLQTEYAIGTETGAATARDADEEELLTAARSLGVELTARQLRWWREQRELSGPSAVAQEYPHDAAKCFLLSGRSFFDGNALDRLEARAVPPLAHSALSAGVLKVVDEIGSDGDEGAALRLWQEPAPGRAYLAVTDTAGGKRRGDFPATLIFDLETQAHVATYRQRVPPSEYARRLAKVGRLFNTATLAVERNNHGGTVLVVLIEQEHYPEIWTDHRDEAGWCTTPTSRPLLVDGLADALLRDELHTHDALIAAECRTFIVHADGIPRAQSGCHDDAVMAAAIGVRLLSTITLRAPPPEPPAHVDPGDPTGAFC
jgi:hypothetical protein